MKILFVDTDCPEALDGSCLDERPLGGTESTLFRIASGLAAAGQEIYIAQHNRDAAIAADVTYIPYSHRRRCETAGEPDAVIVLRNYKILPALRKRFPEARMYLWMHCFPGRKWRTCGEVLRSTRTTVVSVSETLRKCMVDLLSLQLPRWQAERQVATIYNPISPAVMESHSPAQVDRSKLVYFSSPHKGLDQVLYHFAKVRKILPEMRLHLADPGYWNGPRAEVSDGVKILGALPPREIHRHVAEALCVFYPQTSFAETFGLVFAEANALGTPVIAHPIGAAEEVLAKGGKGQVMNCRSSVTVVSAIMDWRGNGRPLVSAHSDFQLPHVLAAWQELLAGRHERDASKADHRGSPLAA